MNDLMGCISCEANPVIGITNGSLQVKLRFPYTAEENQLFKAAVAFIVCKRDRERLSFRAFVAKEILGGESVYDPAWAIQRISEWAEAHLQYVEEAGEILMNPDAMAMWRFGDCDDHATFVICAAEAIGYAGQFVYAKFHEPSGPDFGWHVWAQLGYEDENGEPVWFDVDSSMKRADLKGWNMLTRDGGKLVQAGPLVIDRSVASQVQVPAEFYRAMCMDEGEIIEVTDPQWVAAGIRTMRASDMDLVSGMVRGNRTGTVTVGGTVAAGASTPATSPGAPPPPPGDPSGMDPGTMNALLVGVSGALQVRGGAGDAEAGQALLNLKTFFDTKPDAWETVPGIASALRPLYDSLNANGELPPGEEIEGLIGDVTGFVKGLSEGNVDAATITNLIGAAYKYLPIATEPYFDTEAGQAVRGVGGVVNMIGTAVAGVIGGPAIGAAVGAGIQLLSDLATDAANVVRSEEDMANLPPNLNTWGTYIYYHDVGGKGKIASVEYLTKKFATWDNGTTEAWFVNLFGNPDARDYFLHIPASSDHVRRKMIAGAGEYLWSRGIPGWQFVWGIDFLMDPATQQPLGVQVSAGSTQPYSVDSTLYAYIQRVKDLVRQGQPLSGDVIQRLAVLEWNMLNVAYQGPEWRTSDPAMQRTIWGKFVINLERAAPNVTYKLDNPSWAWMFAPDLMAPTAAGGFDLPAARQRAALEAYGQYDKALEIGYQPQYGSTLYFDRVLAIARNRDNFQNAAFYPIFAAPVPEGVTPRTDVTYLVGIGMPPQGQPLASTGPMEAVPLTDAQGRTAMSIAGAPPVDNSSENTDYIMQYRDDAIPLYVNDLGLLTSAQVMQIAEEWRKSPLRRMMKGGGDEALPFRTYNRLPLIGYISLLISGFARMPLAEARYRTVPSYDIDTSGDSYNTWVPDYRQTPSVQTLKPLPTVRAGAWAVYFYTPTTAPVQDPSMPSGLEPLIPFPAEILAAKTPPTSPFPPQADPPPSTNPGAKPDVFAEMVTDELTQQLGGKPVPPPAGVPPYIISDTAAIGASSPYVKNSLRKMTKAEVDAWLPDPAFRRQVLAKAGGDIVGIDLPRMDAARALARFIIRGNRPAEINKWLDLARRCDELLITLYNNLVLRSDDLRKYGRTTRNYTTQVTRYDQDMALALRSVYRKEDLVDTALGIMDEMPETGYPVNDIAGIRESLMGTSVFEATQVMLAVTSPGSNARELFESRLQLLYSELVGLGKHLVSRLAVA